MLLGIVLHVSLAFVPDIWVVTDAQASVDGLFDEMFLAIHGFRMPVFFLLSGFFTSLLFRRRGVRGLVRQRIARLLLPLILGVCTIGPLVIGASIWSANIRPVDDVWTAIEVGDMSALRRELRNADDLSSRRSPRDGATPLHLAVYMTNREAVTLLLDAGADVRAKNKDGVTPFELAYHFGEVELVDLLVNYGYPDIRPKGTSWDESAGFGDGYDLALRDRDLDAMSVWVQLHHMWFLWFLWWFVVAYVVAERFLRLFANVGGSRSFRVASSWLMWAMIPLTFLPQYFMGEVGNEPGFGPDTSANWLPAAHVLGYYAMFFTFGALLYGRANDHGHPMLATVARPWLAVIVGAIVVVFPVGALMTYMPADVMDVPWWAVSLIQVMYTWGMVIGLLGMFRHVFKVERRGVRYLSDSSYWLYLAHLPLVIVAQAWVRPWAIPAELKFIGLVVVITAILLCSYQAFVRHTWVGRILNGRRTCPQQQ